jgi:small subunit ribosomal protein S11
MAKTTTAKKTSKKRVVKIEPEGQAHIVASFNNLIVTFTNASGQTISWSSAGKAGFRGSKKNTPYAAQIATSEAAKIAYDGGLRRVEVFVRGPGSGRESAIRTIVSAGIDVTVIRDITPLPHNGCRPPKKRRV